MRILNGQPSHTEALEQIETLIDGRSLSWAISALTEICDLKAAHLRETWQDSQTAREWESLGRKLDKVAAQAERLHL